MGKDSGHLFKEPAASRLAQLRIKARRKRRLTYDCLSAQVQGDSVICGEGHAFKQIGRRDKGGLSLSFVLRGMSSSVCQKCRDYNGESEE